MNKEIPQTIIGRPFIPTDNSYSYNLNTNKPAFLAGTYNTPGNVVTIISEPYNLIIKFLGNEKVRKFVTVLYNNEPYNILLTKADERKLNI